MPFVRFADVIVELNRLDDPDVLERAKESPAVHVALEMARPPNWWGSDLDPERLLSLAREDGIPVAWIPSVKVLRELAGAHDSDARRRVLRERQENIIDSCRELLRACNDSWLHDHASLAKASLAA